MKKIFIKTNLITNYIKGNNLTIKEFCKLCNIKYYNYRQLMLGDANVNAETLYRVGDVTKIRIRDLVGY